MKTESKRGKEQKRKRKKKGDRRSKNECQKQKPVQTADLQKEEGQ